jgi:sulfur carrier protein ThiS adenylyltransferase
MADSPDRFERQAALVPRAALEKITATVIGVGAIGRQVALQLAALGVPQLILVDFDVVEMTNVTTQGYWSTDVGLPKVTATAEAIHRIAATIEVHPLAGRFGRQTPVGNVVFCCVDSITTRAALWRQVRQRCDCWLDGRMLGEVMRILSVTDRRGHAQYEATLFERREAQAGTCTAHGTIYTAAIAAGLMVHQLTRWLRHLPLDADLTVNLLASELTAA